MFDPESSQLLQSAPSLPGIEATDLPRLLTEIYTELVTERVRGITGEGAEQSIARLTEIANSYEIIAVTGSDPASVRAAAFVAGSAYQILAKSIPGEIDQTDNILSRDHISGDLAAALLFLVAQQLPDAREAIRRFAGVSQDQPVVIKTLAQSLIDLVREDFGSILNRADERLNYADARHEPQLQAIIYLYELLLQGVELLAASILGRNRPDSVEPGANTPGGIFQRVLVTSVQAYQIDGLPGRYLSTYPGPSHLATLLLNLGQTLLDASILLLPAPDGSDADVWWSWLNYRASQKPLLWPNHRVAINEEFHLPGNSAILVLPTGAGKTTISEFKIAATLAASKQVLFLAPTNALVEQLKTDLAASLPPDLFGIEDDFDTDLFTSVKGLLPALSVMTPEKCLAVLNFNPEAFENVGLVIFDECHSLSAESGSFRRALDGMLVILRLSGLLPSVDFLFLSAMIKEPQQFADWIIELTGKSCISIDLLWKPSRQARGVIIYKQEEIEKAEQAATKLQQDLDESALKRGRGRSAGLRTAPGALLEAVPHAVFGLINNWHPERPEDIRIRQLAHRAYPLNGEMLTSRKVQARQNGNGVSRQLAVASAKAGLKTIVFMNNTLWANKSAHETADLLDDEITYTGHEIRLFAAIETEFGSPDCSMLYNVKRCVQHHADLIQHERQLAESLFKRDNGAKVIFATTTLSQGMNLPAQVAILSADERASLGGPFITQEPMKPHELLNAAGRAGRAGYLANGLVILVPRVLLTFTGEVPEAAAHNVLQSIVPEDERCVRMIDPLGEVLDQIQAGMPVTADIEYLIYRLGLTNEEDNTGNLFRRSLRYYLATKAGDQQNYETAIAAFIKQMAAHETENDAPEWLIQLSIQSGISPHILITLHDMILDYFEDLPTTIIDWMNWLLDWLSHNVEAGRFCFGADMLPLHTIGGVTTITPTNYVGVIENLRKGMLAWLSGETLSGVEKAMGGTLHGQKIYCPKARELATNLAPRSLSYFSTFLVQITKKIAEENDTPVPGLAALECLPVAITKGGDSPEKLAFMHLTKSKYRSRVEAHRDYQEKFEDLELPPDVPYLTIIQMIAELIG